jgi:hypothetical protein
MRGDGTAPDSTRLLAPYMLGLMRTAQVRVPGSALAMGLPWFIQNLPGLQLAMHGGNTFGQHTAFMFAPERGFALVLLTNAEPAGALAECGHQRGRPVVPRLRPAGFAGWLRRVALSVPAGTPTLAPPSDLTQYAGRYSARDTTYVLHMRNGRLLLTVEQMRAPEQILSFIAPTPVHDAPVSFIATDLAGTGSAPVRAQAERRHRLDRCRVAPRAPNRDRAVTWARAHSCNGCQAADAGNSRFWVSLSW